MWIWGLAGETANAARVAARARACGCARGCVRPASPRARGWMPLWHCQLGTAGVHARCPWGVNTQRHFIWPCVLHHAFLTEQSFSSGTILGVVLAYPAYSFRKPPPRPIAGSSSTCRKKAKASHHQPPQQNWFSSTPQSLLLRHGGPLAFSAAKARLLVIATRPPGPSGTHAAKPGLLKPGNCMALGDLPPARSTEGLKAPPWSPRERKKKLH